MLILGDETVSESTILGCGSSFSNILTGQAVTVDTEINQGWGQRYLER